MLNQDSDSITTFGNHIIHGILAFKLDTYIYNIIFLTSNSHMLY